MTKKELELYRKNKCDIEQSIKAANDVVDLEIINKPYDRIVHVLVELANRGVIKARGKGTLAGIAWAIMKVVAYKGREGGQEPSEQTTDSKGEEDQ